MKTRMLADIHSQNPETAIAILKGALTLIKADRLHDPRTGNVLLPAALLIENGKIKEVGSPSQVEAHAQGAFQTIDLGGATLLPGLIDSHTHLFLDIIVPPEASEGKLRRKKNLSGFLMSRNDPMVLIP